MTNKQSNDEQQEWLSGITVFLIRDCELAYLDTFRNLLDHYGFNVLCGVPIEGGQQQALAQWLIDDEQEPGKYSSSGSLPVFLLVVQDVHPVTEKRTSSNVPEQANNLRVLIVKAAFKSTVYRGEGKEEPLSPIHCSCYASQALEYLSTLIPELIGKIRAAALSNNAAFRTPYPVLADLSKEVCRAKVELVDFHGTEAICKTFRPGRERYLEREVKARELGAPLPEVSHLLEIGPHYLVFERYANCMEHILSPRAPFSRHGLLPIWTIERVRAVILHYRSLGYECIDLNPQDLIYDPCQGLKIIDFEFLQPGPNEIKTLKGNYAWYAVPSLFSGDLPLSARQSSYRHRWFPYTGLPRTLCLSELPRPLLAMVRSVALVPLTLDGLRRVSWRHIQRFVRN
ncbi:hypothetical protein J7J47_10740 [Halomonas sp. ISL-60]|nr:hypothetical protein [Halomonas sp. ISL-56]MBT2772704.1 hypothetical protein [Halomonas sp. ISL-60]MBT2804043.1 hypothetical protein [Halomonas sp. ISL-56]OAL61203.1 hypothetical protein A6R74_16545 [Halomonas sp. ALS9]